VEESYRSRGRLIPHKLKFLGTGFNGTRIGDTCASTSPVVVVSLLSLLGNLVGNIVCRQFVREKLRLVSNIWIKLLTLLITLLLIVNCVVLVIPIMSFSVDDFTTTPRLATLASLKKTELMSLATHYKVEVPTGAQKAEIRKIVASYLIEEDMVSEDENTSTTKLELKKLECQEQERERSNQLRLKELELKKQELALQLKIKELELQLARLPSLRSLI